jgi:hypothetical protein
MALVQEKEKTQNAMTLKIGQGLAFVIPSNQGAQFPTILACRLGHLKWLADFVLFPSILEYPLGLEAEAVASMIRVVRNDRHNDLRRVVGIDSLFSHKDMGISRIVGSFPLFQFLSLSGYL